MMSARIVFVLVLSMIVAPVALAFNFAPADPPEPAPEVEFLDAEGNAVTLQDFRGQVVVLNLWATWCAPCRREMPSLDRLQAKLGGDDLQVVALSQDRGESLDKIREFYDEVGVEHLAIYRDPKASVARALRAPGLPTTVVIDGDGREVGRVLGDAEWDGDGAVELLRGFMTQ
jgi:thiol-disulfide isomerase/thioredoxin